MADRIALSSTSSLALALAYLDRHFYERFIFPIKAGAKFPPCVKDNLDGNASNDPAQIAAWAKQFPGCNWGVAHRKSKLLVVDVDSNAAKGKVGQITYDALDLEYEWPATETTTTPSGGHHHIYQGWADDTHPEHIMALGENGIGKDIDSPNYTLIPGCVFKDGSSYVGDDAPAVPCPAWVYDLIKTAKTKQRVSNAGEAVIELNQEANIESAIYFLQHDAAPAIEGSSGDLTTLKTAMYLKDLGISEGVAADLMSEHYNSRCEPAWDIDDLIKKVANAYAFSSLSKAGGKTAQADFADVIEEDFEPHGDPDRIAREVAERKRDREAGVVPHKEGNRASVRYRAQDMPRAVHDAMKAIRTDNVHDHIFRRGPEIVRLNQQLTAAELEGVKPTDITRKRGSLVIRSVVPDYMALRLAEAARFYVKGKPMGRPKNDNTAN